MITPALCTGDAAYRTHRDRIIKFRLLLQLPAAHKWLWAWEEHIRSEFSYAFSSCYMTSWRHAMIRPLDDMRNNRCGGSTCLGLRCSQGDSLMVSKPP